MSDFGAIVYIRKKDRSAIESSDIELVESAVAQVKAATTLSNALAEPYLFQVGKTTSASSGQISCINVLLSNSWGDEKDFAWSQKVEERNSKTIAKELAAILGVAYTYQASFEWW